MNRISRNELEQLRSSVRRFLGEASPRTVVRRLMATPEGHDPVVWSRMARDLALQGLAIPEELGGSGFGPAEQAVVYEEMGRALVCAPFFSTVALAANVLLAWGSDAAKKELLPGIANGASIATVALVEESGRWDPEGLQLRARRSGEGFILDGRKRLVTDGHIADIILVIARVDGELALLAVQGNAPGLRRVPLEALDQTRKLALLEFSGTPAKPVEARGDVSAMFSRALDLAAAALAAEQVGGAERCLEMSVEYAKERVQFGRKIGSFQAIKHKCADMLVAVESARSAAYEAARAAAESPKDLPAAASMAKALCSETYVFVASENIQVHGGIGFSWELDAHLYYRRAHSSARMLGDPAYHRALLAQRLGI